MVVVVALRQPAPRAAAQSFA